MDSVQKVKTRFCTGRGCCAIGRWHGKENIAVFVHDECCVWSVEPLDRRYDGGIAARQASSTSRGGAKDGCGYRRATAGRGTGRSGRDGSSTSRRILYG